MSAGTASLFLTLLFVVFVCADPKIITAESGQDVTLKCRAPNNTVTVLNWTRSDLKPEYVLLYQDGLSNSTHQHPSFKNRVDLQDRQMKDGDVSLILKDVTINDTGTYECHVFIEETRSWKSINRTNLRVVPPYPKIITAESGQDVTLTCRAPNNNIIVVKWSRDDLEDEYVLLYQDGHFFPYDQHPSFKNRVDLQDRQMKDGDVSLILKDVTINDAGTYECRVVQRVRGPMTLIISTDLVVVPPGQTGGDSEAGGKEAGGKEDGGKKDGSVVLIVGLTVPAVLLVVGFLIYRRWKQPKYKPITAEFGQNVTLTCRAPNNNITAVKWSRDDLGDEYVFWSKGAWVVPYDQHPSFVNRVDLQDRLMMNGNVSLILKDVTINDAGIYECRVYMRETDSWELISFIRLSVDPEIV